MTPWNSELYDKYFDFTGWVFTVAGLVIVISTIPAFIFQKHSHFYNEQNKLISIRKQDQNSHMMFIGNILFGVFSILEGSMIIRAGLLDYGLTLEVNARNIIIGLVVLTLGLGVIFKNKI